MLILQNLSTPAKKSYSKKNKNEKFGWKEGILEKSQLEDSCISLNILTWILKDTITSLKIDLLMNQIIIKKNR